MSNHSKVYDTPFTDEEQKYLLSKLYKFNDFSGCHIWYSATDHDGYAIIRTQFRGKLQLFTVHRLNFYLLNGCKFTDINYHVSHLCHNKKCINFEHMSNEPVQINIERNRCRKTKVCIGHEGYKNCIFR